MRRESEMQRNYPRLKKALIALAAAGAILFLSLSIASGQSGSGHTIFGDFKVDESQSNGDKSRTFQVLLYNLIGNVVDRQTVTNNGRYRFFNVANGEYAIVVEFEGAEVARLPLRLNFPHEGDVRQDIELEWKADATKHRGGKKTIEVLPTYNRPAENHQLLQKAENAADKKNYAEAITLLNQVLERDPKDFEAWIELGNAYFNLGKLNDAEKACLRAIDEKPSFILSYLNLGKIRMAGNNYQGAIDSLNEAVKFQPGSAEANYLLGEAYLQIKKGSQAVGYLYEALKLEPIKMADAHLHLAALYNGAGMKDKAAVEYEEFLKKKPDYPERKKLEKYIAENKRK
jgi:tetratricopeptide (TPR) repeat protein